MSAQKQSAQQPRKASPKGEASAVALSVLIYRGDRFNIGETVKAPANQIAAWVEAGLAKPVK